jgi:glycosyltransferase involved in cell wall biosynthesis
MIQVLQHCFGSRGQGGPATALWRFIEASDRSYSVVYQHDPARGFNIPLIFRMIKEINKHNPTLIHIRGLGNEGFHATIAARLSRVPIVLVSIHGTHRDLQSNIGKIRRFVVSRILEPLTLALADAITTVSEQASQRTFLNKYRNKIYPAVPNGVPIPELSSFVRMSTRHSLGIADAACVFSIVSRLSIEKGYIDLADAFKQLPVYSEPPHLIVVGSGPDETEIKEIFKKVNNLIVHFVGQQSDVVPFLQASDVFVFPSWHENLSNALLEGMSCALPVIATSVGGNIEVVSKGGGVLVPSRSPVQLTSALKSAIENPHWRAEQGIIARDNIKKNYSIDAMVIGWEALYDELIRRHYAS